MKKLLIPLLFICSISNAAIFNKGGNSRFTSAGPTGSYGLSHGSTGAPGTIVSPNVGWLPVAVNSSGVVAQKLESIPFPAGKYIDVTAKIVASPKNLAKVLVNPWGMVASMALQETLGYLADQACIRIAGGQMINTGGLWEECKITTQPELAVEKFYFSQFPENLFSSRQMACANHPYVAPMQGHTAESYTLSADGYSCVRYQTHTDTGMRYLTNGYTPISGFYCGSENVADGTACSVTQKKEWAPVPQAIAAAKIEEVFSGNPNLQPSVFEHFVNSESSIEVSEPIISGPSSGPAADPTVTTKNNPDGSITTTTEQKTNNYSYSGNSITITSTTTVITTTNNITNETTTTTTEKPTELTEDFCKLNPELIFCKDIELDTPEGEIPRSTIDLVYAEESFLSGGSCPADVYVSAGGKQIKAIDWQFHCSNISTFVRPLVILLSSFIALLILIPGGREVTS